MVYHGIIALSKILPVQVHESDVGQKVVDQELKGQVYRMIHLIWIIFREIDPVCTLNDNYQTYPKNETEDEDALAD